MYTTAGQPSALQKNQTLNPEFAGMISLRAVPSRGGDVLAGVALPGEQ